MLVDNDKFLTELTRFFEKQKQTSVGSLYITTKRCKGECLLRATLGSRKLSTLIGPRDITKFQISYGNVIKAHIDALKKKERRPRGTVE